MIMDLADCVLHRVILWRGGYRPAQCRCNDGRVNGAYNVHPVYPSTLHGVEDFQVSSAVGWVRESR